MCYDECVAKICVSKPQFACYFRESDPKPKVFMHSYVLIWARVGS